MYWMDGTSCIALMVLRYFAVHVVVDVFIFIGGEVTVTVVDE